MPNEPEIISGPTEVPSDDRASRVFQYRVKQGEEVHEVSVRLPKALLTATDLPPQAAAIAETLGRLVLERSLASGTVPPQLNLGFSQRTFGEGID